MFGFGQAALFTDRRHAGALLGLALREKLRGVPEDTIVVLGLVRGGLPVADAVADALGCDPPVDAFVSRKLGAPMQPEFGIGAIAEGGHTYVNEAAAEAVGATGRQLELIARREAQELTRRVEAYRGGRDHVPVEGKVVVVVDDGLATGATARAALMALRARGARRLVLAVPVGSASSVAQLSSLADDVVALSTPAHFRAVGQWFEDFSQTTDDEVKEALRRHAARNAAAFAAAAKAAAPAGEDTAPDGDQEARGQQAAHGPSPPAAPPAADEAARGGAAPAPAPAEPVFGATTVPIASVVSAVGMAPAVDEEVVMTDAARTPAVQLHGTLNVPHGARGLVVFAHGSGSSRHSPRNRQVAATLGTAGFATLLFDLLSDAEAAHRPNVFDIELLASRLELAVSSLQSRGRLPAAFPLGFFGASTGGGAALWAAADMAARRRVAAVVVRGGRPDLAGARLAAVDAPTLMVVGGADPVVRQLNQQALRQLGSVAASRLVVVPGAGHLFEGPGQLEAVAAHAAHWFAAHCA